MTVTGSLIAVAAAAVLARSGTVPRQKDWRFWELTVDLAAAELVIVDKKGGARLEQMVPREAVAAVNGGYWLADYRPTGWVRDERRVVRKKGGDATKNVVAVSGKRVYVGAIKDLPFEPRFAIQNSPVLVEGPGKIGIRKDDGRSASRTVACKTGDAASLRFIVIIGTTGPGPTLMETAKLLEAKSEAGGFGCTEALNLDGGPSSGVWLESTLGAPSQAPLVPIGYGIAIVPRKERQ